MKLGVSFQYPEKLTPSHLSYLGNMGVETIEVRMFAETYNFDDLLRVQDKVTKAGLDIHEVMLQDMWRRPRARRAPAGSAAGRPPSPSAAAR